jgi:tetratricopeptide (TPR) repeat protein/energy-coupling factor transporter ATP-binding protein EcfA2
MAFWDRFKKTGSTYQPEKTQPEKTDPCEDQTFAPRFKEKKINVFVSSTFKDMIAERDELTLKIFPALKKECELREIAWGEVDLRWGIPEEKSEKGETLSICLKFIDDCRPYFIGMLGERYGWVDPDAPEKLKDDYPWLNKEHADSSITELEILHGVLNNPKMADHAYFYFRDPKYIDTLPEDKRSKFIEGSTPEEIARYGPDEAERRAEKRRGQLVAFKKRIKESGLPLHENYPDPVAFGELVKQDLVAIIKSLSRRQEEISGADKAEAYLDRELAAHEAFVASRFGVYIPRKDYFDRLDAHAREKGAPLVVVGDSGSGKSALLAHWAFVYRSNHPEDLTFFHFIGASSASTDWAMMLRRVMGELKRECGIKMEVPTKEAELRPAFANFLSMAGKKKKVVIVIDALNQLEDTGGAPDLTWLPPVVPDGVRLIVSTLPGRPLDAVKKRGWPEMKVLPLTTEEQRQLVVCYFKQYHKDPSEKMITELVRSDQCSNPLYLRAVMEEIRVHGVYEELVGQVRDLLTAENIPALYKKVLARYEEDYDTERPGLVGETMRLIWASRRGLSKDELLFLLGEGERPLPDAIWAPFYLAAEKGLVEKGGLLTFFHDYLRQAVEARYLSDPGEVKKNHSRLAGYFSKYSEGTRQLEELPWELAEAAEWSRLVSLLTDESFFLRLYDHRQFDLRQYWAQIEAGSSFRMVEAYRPAVQTPTIFPIEYIWNLRELFSFAGHTNEANFLAYCLVQFSYDSRQINILKKALGNLALILKDRGDFDGAMKLLKEQERISRDLNDFNVLAISLGNQANILYTRGDLNGAMDLHKQEEKIYRNLNNINGLALSLNNQAGIFHARHDFDNMLKLLKECEFIYRNQGNIYGLGTTLGNQAVLLSELDDFLGAMKLFNQEEQICRELGHIQGLATSLANQAINFALQGRREEATRVANEALDLALKGNYGPLAEQIRWIKKRWNL